jgi:L-rhamnose mutarotase
MRVALHTRVRAHRNVAWQARTAGLLDVVHDYSEAGSEAGLPVVRELP